MHRMFFLTFAIFSLLGVCAAWALDECIVPHGATYTINEHSVCKRVTNNAPSPKSIMVPTKNAPEWSTGANAFLNALPAGVVNRPGFAGGSNS